MISKELAKYLLEKTCSIMGKGCDVDKAKEVCLFWTQELINSSTYVENVPWVSDNQTMDYWVEVKQELKKL